MNEGKATVLAEDRISYRVQFWILLILALLSLSCSLFLIVRFLVNRSMISAVHNHIMLILILSNVLLIITDVSWMLDTLRNNGKVSFRTSSFCLSWWFFDYTLYTIQSVLLGWASIERHILVFHRNIMVTTSQKWFIHYMPMILLIVYLVCFRIGIIFFPPCENSFDFNRIECGASLCYFEIGWLVIWDKLIHSVLPTFIITIFNVALMYRIVAQKKRLHQPIQWKKQIRISMQLIPISAIYLFLNLPMMIIYIIQIIGRTRSTSSYGTELYKFFSGYIVNLSIPIVFCINSLCAEKHQNLRISPTASLLPSRNPRERNIRTITQKFS